MLSQDEIGFHEKEWFNYWNTAIPEQQNSFVSSFKLKYEEYAQACWQLLVLGVLAQNVCFPVHS